MKNDTKVEKILKPKEKKKIKVKHDQQQLDQKNLNEVSGGAAWEIFKR